ncbi:MAG: phytoene/squalene synthase family protein [Bryobacterales bacterium]|nr:phytoene/squalene synthase family protein [Bryobacterales bacterium]
MTELAASYEYSVAVARARAKNFYYSFLVLPEQKRLAMCAVYAFMRECDDLSDEAGATRERLAEWRGQLDAALAGRMGTHKVWPAFVDVMRRYEIPARYAHEMIDGVSSDLDPRHVETFDDLYRYCYLVASVVGLTTIHIFGFKDQRAPLLAERCGIAFQLTNIIRDAGEDARNGRLYLQAEKMRRFDVTTEALSCGETTDAVRQLLALEGQRARAYYDEARPLIGMMDEDSRPALWALMEIYSRLLRRIEGRGYDVLPGKIRLSSAEKSGVLARAWVQRLLP